MHDHDPAKKDLRSQLLYEAVHHLEEGRRRIHTCLGLLSEEQIWHRPNVNTVSVGNLVLHLCGNVGQWINAKLGGDPDRRDRDKEFIETGPLPTQELLARLDTNIARAIEVIQAANEGQLLATYHVQEFKVSGTGIIVHVVEHFSYHVGQVTLHTKLLRDVDTGYYRGKKLGRDLG